MDTSFEIWTKDISNRDEKQSVANTLVDFANDGDVIGFGSGSTSYLALLALATSEKNITAIPTSYEMEYLCQIHNIKVSNLDEATPTWCFDGADEVDPNGWMIKGRGGAMNREKQVMKACSGKRFILIDESKIVGQLGANFKVPLEVSPRKLFSVETALRNKGFKEFGLRQAQAKDGPVITENGSIIIDLKMSDIHENSDNDLKEIDGIVETGLFIGFNPTIVLPDTTL